MNTALENPALIVPIGRFEHPQGMQVIDRPTALGILSRLSALGRDIVVDYAHESMKQCGRAPAAGWVKTATARLTDKGITAKIEWTGEAGELIEAKKYLYLSPVFEARDGRITGLVNLGLTNNPNIPAMPPLVNQIPTQETPMKKDLTDTLKTLLKLDPDAGDSEIAAAVETLAAETRPTIASLLGDDIALLGLAPDATDDEVKEKIRTMAGSAVANHDSKVERMINDAVEAGRLRPSQKEWAVSLGRANPESLRMFLVNSGPQVPLGGVITCGSPASPGEALTESEAVVCRLLNISEEDYLKHGRR